MYDAILILGGGVRDAGELPPWAAARFELALQLQRGEPLVCLSAGTTHRPPPLEDGFPIPESVAGSRYLLTRGVAPERIRIENSSYDTIGNAYFSKLIHVDPPDWRKLLVITSTFHMPRARAVFEWVYGLGPDKYDLNFAASPDHGDLTSREEREAQRLEYFRGLVQPRIGNLRQLHEWIFTEHSAYSAAGIWRQHGSRDPRVLESY